MKDKVRYFGNAFLHHHVLLVMKALEDEWYVVKKACKFPAFEIFCIVIYCVSALSLHIKTTDSMIAFSIPQTHIVLLCHSVVLAL